MGRNILPSSKTSQTRLDTTLIIMGCPLAYCRHRRRRESGDDDEESQDDAEAPPLPIPAPVKADDVHPPSGSEEAAPNIFSAFFLKAAWQCWKQKIKMSIIPIMCMPLYTPPFTL
jgi:hypothetical protein